jgi:calcineurin-like phosphoesterase family protein
MKKWITSDIHFGHVNILKFCANSRPFRDVDDMDATIIKDWNSLVGHNDVVYILGDVAFLPADRAVRTMRRLNGTKILIKGNHDAKLLRESADFIDCFAEIHDYLDTTHNGHRLIMFHYPIWEWDGMHHGTIHFHGHCHGRPTGVPGKILDVAMDANQCRPVLLDDAIAQVTKLPVRRHH